MRYKFRGKRKDNGEWVYGSLFNGERKKLIMKVAPIKPERENIYPIAGFEVDPATVSQFTGLTDKNGTEIYEGDIVRNEGYVGKVEWNQEMACYHVDFGNGDTDWLADLAYVEVIGSIHSNPELLESEGKS
jgi:uncharacterized phage protein (TIGR01671 family)